MRKMTLLAVILFFAASVVGYSFENYHVDRRMARHVIDRTEKVLAHCARITKRDGVHLGDLKLAYDHQRVAKIFLKEGYFHRAAAHSLRARALARTQIQANNAKAIDEMQVSQDESAISNMPQDTELDNEVSIKLKLGN